MNYIKKSIKYKNASKYYMVVIHENSSLDIKILKNLLWESKLSFASEERMIKKIWVKPWHVSPFAHINDEKRDIKVIFDEKLNWVLIWFHPLQNDNTVVLKMSDIEIFLKDLGVEFSYLSL